MAEVIEPKGLDFIFRYRWWAAFCLGVGTLLFEVAEHYATGERLSPSFVIEVVIFALVIPLAFGLILSRAASYQEQQPLKSAQWETAVSHLIRQLRTADNWESLANSLVHFPQQLVACEATILLWEAPEQRGYQSIATWQRQSHSAFPAYPALLVPENSVIFNDLPLLHKIDPAHYKNLPAVPKDSHAYCLPCFLDSKPIALLHIFTPEAIKDAATIRFVLSTLCPALAAAIYAHRNTGPQYGAQVDDETAREYLFRQLHDVIGQQIGYLAMQLDHAASQSHQNPTTSDLAALHGIADDAYRQIRETLMQIQENPGPDLAAQLHQTGLQAVSRQPGLSLQVTTEGTSRVLSPATAVQINAIVNEALNNVVKHANAQNVTIALTWQPQSLAVSVTDDGSGIHNQALTTGNNLGMQIMRDRAAAIQSQLTIDSQPHTGTKITITLPLA